jgi:hypothetical protein
MLVLKLGLEFTKVEVLLNTIGFYLQYRFLVHIERDLILSTAVKIDKSTKVQYPKHM